MNYLELTRAIVRPIVTILFSVAYLEYVYLYMTGQVVNAPPREFSLLTGGILVFWFGERALQKLMVK